MQVVDPTITRKSEANQKGEADDGDLNTEIIRLYEAELDLISLPRVLFDRIGRLIEADVVTYTEFHHASGEFRSLLSVEDDPDRRAGAMAAFARHMNSHAFWRSDPAFFGERAVRESDIFGEEEFVSLPIVREVFLPSGARRIMSIVMQNGDYVLNVSGHRVVGRPAFTDRQRDLLAAFRPHILRCHRQACERTLASLTPADRLRIAFPELTPRQLEVASWVARGKSNEDIAAILDVGIETIKAHVKAIHAKIGADGRLAIAVIAHTAPPFGRMPPLWRIGEGAWGAQ